MEFRLVVDLSPETKAFLSSIGLGGARAMRTVSDALPAITSAPKAPSAAPSVVPDSVPVKKRGRPTKEAAALKAAGLPVVPVPAPKKAPLKAVEVEADDEAEDESEDESEDADALEDEAEEDTDDEDDDGEADEIEDEADEPENDRIDAKELKALKTALRLYSEKHTKQAAVKILMKYAKVSQDVKKTDLPKLLKALKA